MNQNMVRVIYERHADNIYRLCYSYMKNSADAQDALQNTFIKLMKADKEFESEDHEKAWLIVTAGNTCKDMLKSWWRRVTVSYDENVNDDIVKDVESTKLLEEILKLPTNIRVSLYLHYYEGYSSAEIGRLLKKSDGSIRGYLVKGRKILKERLGEF